MNKTLEAFFEYADAEFHGESYNGPSLMKTLRSLSPADAASEETHEGYSAWSVALHVAYCKYLIVKGLGKAAPLEPYPYGTELFPPPPTYPSQAAWTDVLQYLVQAHRACQEAFLGLDEAGFDAVMPEWKISYRKVAAWYLSHDAYHAAQIRNMGVPGLKEPKEPS